MRNWAYILVFLFISAEAYAGCPGGFCPNPNLPKPGNVQFLVNVPGPAHPGPDLSQKGLDSASNAGLGADRAALQAEGLKHRIGEIDERTKKIDAELEKIKTARTANAIDPAELDRQEKELNDEKNKLADERKDKSDKLIQQQAQQLADAASAMQNNANGQQAKQSGGSGMPFMPPKSDSGGGDEGGGDKPPLEAPKQPTPPPQPTPPAVAAKANEIMSEAEFQAAMKKAGESQVSSGSTSATKAEIAALEQRNAELKIEAEKAKAVAAVARAEASLAEMEKSPTPRSTGTTIASTNGSGNGGSPFDLSSKSASGSPSMNAVKTNSSNKSPASTNGSGATMTAVKITPSSKEQASSRLLASATGTAVSESSGLNVTSTSANGAVRNGVVTKKKSSGPVYGMRSTSTRSGVYSNMTVPKALATTMNTRLAVVGGSTPQNHQPPVQVAGQPAAKPTYTYDPNARMRNAQPVSAHVIR